MKEFDKTILAAEALRMMQELYAYCDMHDIPFVSMFVYKRLQAKNGGVDEENYQGIHGKFNDLSPAMQAFSVVSQLPDDAQVMAVAMLLQIETS